MSKVLRIDYEKHKDFITKFYECFPQNEIELTQDHKYFVNGENGKEQYYSVSKVLEPINQGIKKIPSHILNKASHNGSNVHSIIELYVKGLVGYENGKVYIGNHKGIEEFNDELLPKHLDNFIRLMESNNLEPVLSEVRV
ncbi:MAG: hypothetical protein ACRCXT_12430 [Paraclostridium sp.]